MPYGKRSSVAGKIARGKTKPAMGKKKKKDEKGFLSGIKSGVGNKIQKKKKSFDKKMAKLKKLKGMF